MTTEEIKEQLSHIQKSVFPNYLFKSSERNGHEL